MTDVDSALEAAHEAYVDGINSNNVDNVLAAVTEDIVFLPPNSCPIVGKRMVGPWVAAYFDEFHTEWVKKTVELNVQGDLAFEWYTYQATNTALDGGAVTTDNGNGVNIYRPGADGIWRVSHDVWATSRPAS